MPKQIKNPESERMICIVIPNPVGRNTYDRVPSGQAASMLTSGKALSYTSKSRYKRYLRNGI